MHLIPTPPIKSDDREHATAVSLTEVTAVFATVIACINEPFSVVNYFFRCYFARMTTCPSCGWKWNAVRPALTMREAATFDALLAWEGAGHKTGPSFRELAEATDTSVTRVHAAIKGLVKKGHVVFIPGHGRSLKSARESNV